MLDPVKAMKMRLLLDNGTAKDAKAASRLAEKQMEAERATLLRSAKSWRASSVR
jgi:hypothetical protein